MSSIIKNNEKTNLSKSIQYEYNSLNNNNKNNKNNDNSSIYLFKYIFLMNVALYIEAGAVPALLLQLTETFHMSRGSQGLLGGVVYLSISLAGPLAGYLLKTYEPKVVLLISMTLNGCFTLLWALTPVNYSYSTAMFVFVRALIGFTQCFLCVYSPIWADTFAPIDKRTSWMSYLQASVPMGVMFGYILASGFTWYSNGDATQCGPLLCWRLPLIIEVILTIPFIFGLIFVPKEHIDIKTNTNLYDNRNKFNIKKKKLNKRKRSYSEQLNYQNIDDNILSISPIRFSSDSSDDLNNNNNNNKDINNKNINNKIKNKNPNITPFKNEDLNNLNEFSLNTPINRNNNNNNNDDDDDDDDNNHKKIDHDIFFPSSLKNNNNDTLYQTTPYIINNNNINDDDDDYDVDDDDINNNDENFNMNELNRRRLLRRNSEGRSLFYPEYSINEIGIINNQLSAIYENDNEEEEEEEIERDRELLNTLMQEEDDIEEFEFLKIRKSSFYEPNDINNNNNNDEEEGITSPLFQVSPFKLKKELDDNGNEIDVSPPSFIEYLKDKENDIDNNKNSHIKNFKNKNLHPELIASPSIQKFYHDNTINNIIHQPSYWTCIKILFHIPLYFLLVFALTALYFVVTGVQFWGTLYLTVSLHGSPYEVNTLFILTAATGPTFGVFFGGWLIDYFGGYKGIIQRTKSLKICLYLGLFAAFFAYSATFTENIALAAFCLWNLLFFGGSILPACTGIIVSIVPLLVRPVSSSISLVIFNLFGYCLSLVLSGYIMQIITSYYPKCDLACSQKLGFRFVLFWCTWAIIFLSWALFLSLNSKEYKRALNKLKDFKNQLNNPKKFLKFNSMPPPSSPYKEIKNNNNNNNKIKYQKINNIESNDIESNNNNNNNLDNNNIFDDENDNLINDKEIKKNKEKKKKKRKRNKKNRINNQRQDTPFKFNPVVINNFNDNNI